MLREAPDTEIAHGDPAHTETQGPSRTGVAAEAEAPSRTKAATLTPADHPGTSGGARVLVRSIQAVMASLLLLLAGGAAYGYYRYSQADN